MSSLVIVIHFDILENRLQCILRAHKAFSVDPFGFKNTEKRLSHRIIPTIAFSAHTLNKMMFFKKLPKIIASILDTAIRVKHQAGRRSATPYRSMKGCKHHLCTQRTTQRPSDHHRENRSRITVRYSQPCCVRMYVISDTHTLFGASVVKLRRRRLGTSGFFINHIKPSTQLM